jgi:hypothetical protein
LEERLLHTQEVIGSSPVGPIFFQLFSPALEPGFSLGADRVRNFIGIKGFRKTIVHSAFAK